MGRLASLIAVMTIAVAPAPGPLVGAGRAPAAVPLAASPTAPGVGRCTSDGACTVTNDDGTRQASPLRLFP
jgi:hypothetical protein